MEVKQESGSPKKKPRPLVRIALLLMSHRVLVSLICCIAGVIALLLLPVLAKNTYISENALMPGSANPMLSSQEVLDADKLVTEIMRLSLEGDTAGIEIPRLLKKRVEDLGAEVSQFQFYPQTNKFHPLHFFSSHDSDLDQDNTTCVSPAVSTVGIVRAPHGDGKEAIIMVTPYNAVKTDAGEALSLGVAYSVFSLLTQVTWLAKDIIWLAADSRYGEHESVSSWLREYYAPTFYRSEKSRTNMCSASNPDWENADNQVVGAEPREGFRRAGTMAAALVIKVNGNKDAEDSLSIYAEASNGQMPNLDLINVVNYLAVHRQGLYVMVGKHWSLLESKCLKMIGGTIESLGNLARSLNPQWGFGIPVNEYVEGAATLTSSLYAQALGVPTGSHGAFRDYQIDAVTLAIAPKASPYNKGKRSDFLLRSGRLIEGTIRSVNNLLEKFHQSFFLYLLTGPSKFVSVGVYMIAFALLLAPLPVVAASLYSDAVTCHPKSDMVKSSASGSSSDMMKKSGTSWRWLHAAKSVFVIHIWAAVVALLPYVVCQIPNRTSTTCSISWILLSLASLQIFYMVFGSPYSSFKLSDLHKQEWAVLKSVMISAAFIGLSLMSVVNFAAAEIGALLLVPFCLMAQPLKLDMQNLSLKAFSRIACNIVLGLSLFPPFTFFVIKGLSEGFSSINIGDFWTWAESLWLWNSATYLYVLLVHLPCWVLCIHLLLHPC
ncbi:glycosylphosphatidylinositol anchor attachment 1 protein-like [Chenopodium quinoa]|uniref:glycosylphosphatidylinositol anchor attachment 1 protein-like n=1 Tax=Chenopodium quinoa TaxID=63459 RepID=UPI000B797656|nr:glycosylphosphatidylinositol anchor attachment 1 protein-like [Chenopodium quinoa]